MIEDIQNKLNKNWLSGKEFLSGYGLIDERSRQTSTYCDPKYFAFYYFLAQKLSVKKVLNIDVGLGLEAVAFLKGCKKKPSFIGFHTKKEGSYYCPLFALHNVKKINSKVEIYTGHLDNLSIQLVDYLMIVKTAFVIEEMNRWWDLMKSGIMTVDYANQNKNVINLFAKIKNKDYNSINTKFGVAVFRK